MLRFCELRTALFSRAQPAHPVGTRLASRHHRGRARGGPRGSDPAADHQSAAKRAQPIEIPMAGWTWVENWVENSVQLEFWSSLISRCATLRRATARVLVNVFRLYRAVVVADECEAWWRRCSRSAPASEPSVTPPARLSRFMTSSGMPAAALLRANFFGICAL